MKKIILAALLFSLFLHGFSQMAATKELAAKDKTVKYTHSIGSAAVFSMSWGTQPVDFLFSFSQNGVFKKGRKTLSPLWNLLPHYELGVNDKFYLKLEHYCTYRNVITDSDPHSRNHSIYIYLRGNVLHRKKNKNHKMLVGGLLMTTIYREKQIDENKYKIGFTPELSLGASAAYYYNFANNFYVFCSLDLTITCPVTTDYLYYFYSSSRTSVGLQYSFK